VLCRAWQNDIQKRDGYGRIPEERKKHWRKPAAFYDDTCLPNRPAPLNPKPSVARREALSIKPLSGGALSAMDTRVAVGSTPAGAFHPHPSAPLFYYCGCMCLTMKHNKMHSSFTGVPGQDGTEYRTFTGGKCCRLCGARCTSARARCVLCYAGIRLWSDDDGRGDNDRGVMIVPHALLPHVPCLSRHVCL
jgi:hypothetical protein